MQNDKKILAAIERAGGVLLSARQIADEAGFHPGEYKSVQQRLRELTRAGRLEREGRRFRLAKEMKPVVVQERPKGRRRGEVPGSGSPAGARAQPRTAPTETTKARSGGEASPAGSEKEPTPRGGRKIKRGEGSTAGAEKRPTAHGARKTGRGEEDLPAAAGKPPAPREGRKTGRGAAPASAKGPAPREAKKPGRGEEALPATAAGKPATPWAAKKPRGGDTSPAATGEERPAPWARRGAERIPTGAAEEREAPWAGKKRRRDEERFPPGKERTRGRESIRGKDRGEHLRHGEIIGTLTLRPEGYGFVERKQGPPGDDVFLPPHEIQGAMDGDRVRVRIVRGKFGRDAGVLEEILSHRRRNFLGTYETRGRATFVVPVDPTMPHTVPVRPVKDVRTGQVVKVAITGYVEEAGALRGEVVKVVGEPGDPIVEVLEVAYANGFAEEFPADVQEEAEAIPDHVSAEEAAGRRDLRPLHLVTIDGADARDFDDAVCVERLPRGGYRLVVAIADVAHYVRPGTHLDDEAVSRGTSVYFPNHVLPMLPERLSNGICSLNPGVDRLCMVCDLALDAEGRPVEAQIYEAVMRSHARCTYEQVAELLAGTTPPALSALEDDLLLAGELAAKLRRQRTLRGALDFDLPEAKAVLDEHMLPTAIVRRERNDAHRLIEEFMLAANEAVARHFSDRDLPTVYRVHGEPDPEKLERFASLARSVGFAFDVEEGMPPGRVAAVLREIEGTPQQRALNSLLLRSMMQAIYQPENIGHYGLASEHYLHFTSPIRRYPDLLVHRLLKELWARAGRSPKGREREQLEERLDELAASSSERERAATGAEREIDQYFKCLFVRDKVGEAYDATVIALTDFGFFAELDETPVEGLVRAEELGTRWELDEERHRLIFPATGRSFAIGDAVRVEIASVDLGKRQISLAMVAPEGAEAAAEGPTGLLAAIDRRRAAQQKGRAPEKGREPPSRRPEARTRHGKTHGAGHKGTGGKPSSRGSSGRSRKR